MVFVYLFECGLVDGDFLGGGEWEEGRRVCFGGPGMFNKKCMWAVVPSRIPSLEAQVPQAQVTHPAIAGIHLPTRA